MEKLIDGVIASDAKNADKAVTKFIEKASQTFAFEELKHDNRRIKIWKSLYNIAKETDKAPLLIKCFSAVRILSREKQGLNEVVTEDWMDLMNTHCGLNTESFSFEKAKTDVVVAVQNSMTNVIMNSGVAANIASRNGTLTGILARMKRYKEPDFPEDVKIFDMELVFLITALCSEVRNSLRKEYHGVTYMMEALDHILKQTAENRQNDSDKLAICLTDKQVELVVEILKALFNITGHVNANDPEELVKCIELVQILRNYLLVPTASKEQTRRLQNNVINLLTNMPLESYNALLVPVQDNQSIPNKLQYDGQNMMPIYEMLMVLEDKLTIEHGVSNQHAILSPVLCALLKCATANRAMRKYLRVQILPPLRDVHRRPEHGGTLRNGLCRLLTSPVTQLKIISAELLFILCKMSVQRMIKYTGYGNAAGLFAQRGLLGGRPDEGAADFSSDSGESETEEYAEFKHGINPVTGCFEVPHPDPMKNMSDEQKEYEAIRLVELIDSLIRTGTIRPCVVDEHGQPQPVEHVLQLQEGIGRQQIHQDSGEDSE